jgi:hypothetical protein
MSRHIQPPQTNPVNPTTELHNSVRKLITLYPPSSLEPSGGLYAGLLSVTYLFWKLDKILPPDWNLDGKTARDWFDAYWTQVKRYDRALLGERGIEGLKIRPWRCGVGDDTVAYAALLVVVALEDRHPGAEDQVRAFCQAVKQVVGPASRAQEQRHGKPASNEWLYGRSGTLYLLRMIRSVAHARDGEPVILQEIDDSIRKLIEEIVEAPRPWVWHGKAYLGAVHGSAGIIYQVVESMKIIGLQDQRLLDNLQGDIEQILDLQLPSGNWPSSIPLSSSQLTQDRLVQFCHGSPGIIPCLKHITALFSILSHRIATAISTAESDILARGWLTKEPSLCHGATGSAMSLSSPDDRIRFLSGTTESALERLQEAGVLGRSDSAEGLWTGLAGRAWVWGVCAVGGGLRKGGAFLGFDDV